MYYIILYYLRIIICISNNYYDSRHTTIVFHINNKLVCTIKVKFIARTWSQACINTPRLNIYIVNELVEFRIMSYLYKSRHGVSVRRDMRSIIFAVRLAHRKPALSSYFETGKTSIYNIFTLYIYTRRNVVNESILSKIRTIIYYMQSR